MYADKQYILDLRHRIHEYPEIDFELPKTIALVKAELDKLGIPYTEEFGESSVVAYINPDKCKLCRKCVNECPTGSITMIGLAPLPKEPKVAPAPKAAPATPATEK